MTTPSPMRQQPGNGFAAWRRDVAAIWRELRELRSSQGVLNGGTVTKDGGIKIEGAGSIVSENPGGGTRIRDGVIEVRPSPIDPWAPAESVWIDPINVDLAAAQAAIEANALVAQQALDDAAQAILDATDASKLDHGTLDASLAPIETDGAADRGVKIFSAGIIGYDTSGNPRTIIDNLTGKITAVDGEFTGTVKATSGEISGILDLKGSGLLRTDASGQRVQFGTSGLAGYGSPGMQVDVFPTEVTPQGIALDSAGNIYVGSWQKITKYSPTGVALQVFSLPNVRPGSLAVDGSGNVYAPDNTTGNVYKLNSSGTLTLTFGYTGICRDIVIDSSGIIILADATNNLIRRFNTSGVQISSFSTTGTPWAVTVVGSVIVVADNTNSLIRRFSSTGTQLSSFSAPKPSGGVYSGIKVDTSGNVYVSHWVEGVGGSAVKKYSSTGDLLLTIDDVGIPMGMAIDTAGYIYVADNIYQIVRKLAQGNDLSVSIESATGRISATQMLVTGGFESDLIKAGVITSDRGLRLNNVVDPHFQTDAANKAYVDRRVDFTEIQLTAAANATSTANVTMPSLTKTLALDEASAWEVSLEGDVQVYVATIPIVAECLMDATPHATQLIVGGPVGLRVPAAKSWRIDVPAGSHTISFRCRLTAAGSVTFQAQHTKAKFRRVA